MSAGGSPRLLPSVCRRTQNWTLCLTRQVWGQHSPETMPDRSCIVSVCRLTLQPSRTTQQRMPRVEELPRSLLPSLRPRRRASRRPPPRNSPSSRSRSLRPPNPSSPQVCDSCLRDCSGLLLRTFRAGPLTLPKHLPLLNSCMTTFCQHVAMVSACQTAVLPSLRSHLGSAKQAFRKVSHDSPC